MRSYNLLLSLIIFCPFVSKAQLVNSGQIISLSNNSLIFVDGNFIHNSGSVLDNGTLELKGNFENTDQNSVVFDNSSTGVVLMSGALQEITGLKTVFPSLRLSGSDDKSLKADADVMRILSLGNKQFSINEHRLHILNPDPAAVLRADDPSITGTGFISTDTRGQLVRNTNSDLPYLFPLGGSVVNSGLPTVRILYRPLQLEPENSLPNTFAASLLNYDATNDGYDKSRKRSDIKVVSDKYYYFLNQSSGSSLADLTFYQNLLIDRSYSQLVNWSSSTEWEKVIPAPVFSGDYGDDLNGGILNRSITYRTTQLIQNKPFTFSSDVDILNPFIFYNAFSPDGDNRNDTWKINNIELYPDNKLSIFNRWGDEVFRTDGYANDRAWDGGNLQSGTFYYILTTTIENQPRAFKGFITMIKRN